MSSNARYWPGAIFLLAVVILFLATLHHYGANRRLARLAMEMAQDSGLLEREIGAPISMGILVHGRVSGGSEGGTADLEIPVYGSEGKGTLLVWEQGGSNSWRVCSLAFRSTHGMEIVIVSDETSHCQRE